MLCYRDMTFCEQKTCAEFGDVEKGKCFRSLTEEVKQKAAKIDLGVAIFTDRPDCFVEFKPEKE